MALKRMLVIACMLLAASWLRAQTSPEAYELKWKQVDSLLTRKGLPETAMAEINRIYTLAVREHNDAQEIKALIYRVTAGSSKDEGDTAGKGVLESAVRTAAQPARSILQSLLAQSYWYYLQQHRWKLYGR